MCAGHSPTYWTTFGSAEKKIEMVAVHCTNETTLHLFEFLTPPPPAPRARWTQRGRGTSADIVPTHIKFGVDPSTRCWDIAQKPPKFKNFPLTPIVTKISFSPFSAPGPLTTKGGEDTSGTRVRPHGKFGVNRPAGCREIVDKKRTKNKQTYSKTNTSPFALTSEWRVTRALRERKLRQGRCIVVLWWLNVMSYKMPYLVRPLQRRPLVSNSIS